MKKTFKILGVFAACVPVAALAACGLKPAADPSATYNAFAEKYNTAYEALLAGDLYFTSYSFVSIQAEGEKGKLYQRTSSDWDYEAAKGEIVKFSAYGSAEFSLEAEEKTSYAIDFEGYLKEGKVYSRETYKMNDETTEDKSVEDFSSEYGSAILSEAFFFPNNDDVESIFEEDDVEIKSNKSNTQMQISASVNPAVFTQEFATASVVLGEYEYDYDTSFTYTVRFDNAGNLLYIDLQLKCVATAIAPTPAEEAADGEEPSDGETAEGGEETAPAPTDSVTIVASSRVTVKDASTVKLPTQTQLDAFKNEEAAPEETPDNENNDGE